MTLLVNRGLGSFERRSIDVSGVPVDLRAGAFDWDSFDDLVVIEAPTDGVTHLEIAKGTNLAASQVVLTAPDAPGLFALATGAYGGVDSVSDLIMLGVEPGGPPYLASVAMLGEGTDFFSDVLGPPFTSVTQILIATLGDNPGRNDVVGVFENRTRGETQVWVFPDQGSYLHDREAYGTLPIAEEATSPTSLADVDGDGVDELVFADAQGIAIYDLVTASSTPVRIPAPAATALATVRRAGGDCLILGGAAGAALACDLRGSPAVHPLTSSPAYGAAAADIDGDGEAEGLVVLGSTLETYELAPISTRDRFALSATRDGPTSVCSGDFDGDGVVDVALTSNVSVELWWGVPHDREFP